MRSLRSRTGYFLAGAAAATALAVVAVLVVVPEVPESLRSVATLGMFTPVALFALWWLLRPGANSGVEFEPRNDMEVEMLLKGHSTHEVFSGAEDEEQFGRSVRRGGPTPETAVQTDDAGSRPSLEDFRQTIRQSHREVPDEMRPRFKRAAGS